MKLFIAILAGLMLTGCSWFAPPSPEINFYNIRMAIQTDDDYSTSGTLKSAKAEVVEGDKVVMKAKWLTDQTFYMKADEKYRENPTKEILESRQWEVKATNTATDAKEYGINQTNKTTDTANKAIEAGAAAATGGASTVGGAVDSLIKNVTEKK